MICRSRRSSNFRVALGSAALVLSLLWSPAQATAQNLSMPDIPVITIEADRLFAATQFGQRLARDLEERGSQLAAENRRIEAELEEEESRLTALRPTTDPTEFRKLADAFDARVQKVRAEQDEKARRLAQISDQAQRGFLQAIAPILETMMNELGSSVILDRRAVFLSADASDITERAIDRINAELGDGQPLDVIVGQAGESGRGPVSTDDTQD